ncbi:MAG: polyphenol oxidase family protein [Candidatus Kapaibacterium sp.]
MVFGITTRESGGDFRRPERMEDRASSREAWERLRMTHDADAAIRRHQVHGCVCEQVDGMSPTEEGVADALFTTSTGVLIAVTVADCCGVVLWSRTSPLVACIHSGWRGTRDGIVNTSIDRIRTDTDTPTGALHAWLSPCASGRSYLVRGDVREVFPDYCRQVGEDQFLFDNRAAIRDQLVRAGVPPGNVTVSDTCTMEDPLYHSYRRDGENSGRNAVFALLRYPDVTSATAG